MRKIREVLRLRLEADLSVRQISICTKVSVDKKATSVAVNMVRESHN
ncbi:hypothetical protein AHGSH82_024620 [Aeromonas hydrophila]|jgi:hypothetical protein|nr:hypothetical protein [Aeromonas hydrophila]BBG85317.1 hypothetical protein AHGSH82_024620 [Aeromonas hydrophila]BBT62623.1 hypothetical protein WP8S18E02_24200 [Aeromonas hydrophila]